MPRSGRYRGRRRITRLLSGIGIILVITSVLSVTAYLFLRDYVTRTDDGFLLSLPFMNNGNNTSPSSLPVTNEPADDTDDIDKEDILIVEQSPTPPPTPVPEPEPVPVSAQITVAPAFLSQKNLNKTAKLDELSALCDAGDIDTIIIEVKSVSGVIADAAALTKAAEHFDGRAKLVAYFSVLEDNSITRQRGTFGIKHTSGVNWLDSKQSRWINPYIPEAREWLAAQLSAIDPEIFSAVLIDNLWFPQQGRLELMVLKSDIPQEEILETLKSELFSSTTLPCWLVEDQNITYEGDIYSEFPTGAFE